MTQYVYIVDDDEAIRDSLSWLLQSRNIACRTYDSAESFLEAWEASFAGCLLLDIRMGEMSGNELFDRLVKRGCKLPVIFLTAKEDEASIIQSARKMPSSEHLRSAAEGLKNEFILVSSVDHGCIT